MTTAPARPSVQLVCYHFPPWGMGGVQRSLKLARYLPEFGWDVTVIAPRIMPYHQVDPSLLAEIPASVRILRVGALDPAAWLGRPDAMRPLNGVRRRPLARLARVAREWLRWPDDKILFASAACRRTRRLRREDPFDVIWTTSPPPSSHYVGYRLRSYAGWVADFRDPWLAREGDWGPTGLHRRFGHRLRNRFVRAADHVIAVSAPIAERLAAVADAAPVTVIHNGYDDADFPLQLPDAGRGTARTIICPGTFSPHSNPTPVFAAAAALRARDPDRPLRIVHVGTQLDLDAHLLARRIGISDIYDDHGYRPHREAVQLLCGADLVAVAVTDLPGFGTNIPGRLYEALRSLRPLVLFASATSAAGSLAARIPGCRVVSGDDPGAGAAVMADLMSRFGRMPARTIESIRMFDRREQARQLAAVLADVRARRAHRGKS